MTKEAKAGQAETSAAQVKIGSFRPSSRLSGWLHKLNRRSWVVVVLVLIIVAATVAGLYWHGRHKTIASTPNVTLSEYAGRLVKERKSNQPAANATTDQKISYYSALVKEEYRSKQYDAGLADYKQLMSLVNDTSYPDSTVYVTGAYLYAAKGDKQTALAELAKARALDNQEPDALLRSQLLSDIDQVQQDIEQ